MEQQNIDLINTWNEARTKADYWTKKERELRQEVTETVAADKQEGTTNVKLPGGYTLKVVTKNTIKPASGTTIGDIEQAVDNEWVSSNLFKRKYDVSIAAYRKLTPEQRKVAAELVEIKPTMPTVSLVAPKEDVA